VAGRPFEKSDTINEILVNETHVNKLGAKNPNEVIGKEIMSGRSTWKNIVLCPLTLARGYEYVGNEIIEQGLT
jgi:hypothetical protein